MDFPAVIFAVGIGGGAVDCFGELACYGDVVRTSVAEFVFDDLGSSRKDSGARERYLNTPARLTPNFRQSWRCTLRPYRRSRPLGLAGLVADGLLG